MMRQSPKPYAKSKVRRTPPCPRSEKYCQGAGTLSTVSCVEYPKVGAGIRHLWGSSPTNHPFVLFAGQEMSIRYGKRVQPRHDSTSVESDNAIAAPYKMSCSDTVIRSRSKALIASTRVTTPATIVGARSAWRPGISERRESGAEARVDNMRWMLGSSSTWPWTRFGS